MTPLGLGNTLKVKGKPPEPLGHKNDVVKCGVMQGQIRYQIFLLVQYNNMIPVRGNIGYYFHYFKKLICLVIIYQIKYGIVN